MGSGNSRHRGSPVAQPINRPPPPPLPLHVQHCRPSFKRSFSSILICGSPSSSSSHSRHEMEDDAAELLFNSAEHSDPEKIQFPTKSSVLLNSSGNENSRYRLVSNLSSEKAICPSRNYSRQDASQNGAKINMESSSKEKQLRSISQSISNWKRSETTTVSCPDVLPSESLVVNSRIDMNVVNNGKGVMHGTVSGNSAGVKFLNGPSSSSPGLASDELSPENPQNEVMVFHKYGSASGSAASDSSPDKTSVIASSSGFGSLVSDREDEHRDENELQMDTSSVSSNIPSSSSSELTNYETRRESRRLFWDAFPRRSSRRNSETRTFVFTTDDADGLGSHDRRHFDYTGDFFDDEIGGGSRSYSSSNQSSNEHRLNSSSEGWERSRDVGDNESDRRTAICPSGIHPDGRCRCASISTAEDFGPHASISRIVMLAEALFEVLDEVHRQPLSISLSAVSLPAAESVVDSLPVKKFRNPERTEGREDSAAQCYICLAEYSEGDSIRVLPCHHEFHTSCVDKWLKEIHGVCPLCRGVVREGIPEG